MAVTCKIDAANTVSMTDLRRVSLSEIMTDSPVAVLNHNKAAAYLLSAEHYEYVVEQLENLELAKVVKERQGGKTVKVNIEDL